MTKAYKEKIRGPGPGFEPGSGDPQSPILTNWTTPAIQF